MSTLAIAIGATSLSLVLVFVWMFSLSLRKKRMEEERIAREAAYRRAMEKARQQERQDRIFKAETGHVPTILYLAKEAERNKPNEALYWYHKGALLDNITSMYGIVRLSDKKREDLVLREQANYWRLCIAGAEAISMPSLKPRKRSSMARVLSEIFHKVLLRFKRLRKRATSKGSCSWEIGTFHQTTQRRHQNNRQNGLRSPPTSKVKKG
ncbi:TPR repeat protein SEL1 subfamily [Vibrio maritimus]|uniref:TPR repeat protein SEL1 subfamily n=1 Tax=Vibrio maritimus TaxID=990268 RepID=A0A090RQ31_9VIBR|nr:TPR repeat protein SEL1 subfamily [Vibrio maritimus]